MGEQMFVELFVAVVGASNRWILARLRNETFFSITKLNARVRELPEDLNAGE